MKRFFLPASVFVLMLVLTACGAGSGPAPQVTRTGAHPSVKAIVAHRKAAAGREAVRLLRGFHAPPGAARTQRPRGYGGVLLSPGPSPAAERVDRVGFWSLRGSFSSAFAYVRSHGPEGFVDEGETRSAGGQTPRNESVSFVRGGTRFFNVAVVQLPGRVVIRVDAKVVWIYPRSPSEKVPPAVSRIAVRWPKGSATITDPAKVARVVRWFDALPVSPPGIILGCPLSLAPSIELDFLSASGAPLARAQAPAAKAWLCSTIGFTIRGRRQMPLIDAAHGPSFVSRLQRLLGVRLIESRR